MSTAEPSIASKSTGETILESSHATTVGMAMMLIQDAIRMGQPDLARALVLAARKRWGDEPSLCLIETMLEAKSGNLQGARRALAVAEELAPGSVISQVYAALLAIEAREPAMARRRLREVIGSCPDYPGVAGMLAALLMPGPNYRDVLGQLHQMIAPRGYLEIGVETGATLSLARAERIVGIDPDFAPLRRERLAAHAQLFEMKSQEFFERHQREQVLGEVPLDLVFIDGLHRFDAALWDFHAVECWAHRSTVVVMHDALPVAKIYAQAERRTRFWVGDVWKAVVVLLRARPDLTVRVIPTVPSGLVVIRWSGVEPRRVERSEVASMIAGTAFPELGDEDPVWPEAFPLVRNDAQGYAAALSS